MGRDTPDLRKWGAYHVRGSAPSRPSSSCYFYQISLPKAAMLLLSCSSAFHGFLWSSPIKISPSACQLYLVLLPPQHLKLSSLGLIFSILAPRRIPPSLPLPMLLPVLGNYFAYLYLSKTLLTLQMPSWGGAPGLWIQRLVLAQVVITGS